MPSLSFPLLLSAPSYFSSFERTIEVYYHEMQRQQHPKPRLRKKKSSSSSSTKVNTTARKAKLHKDKRYDSDFFLFLDACLNLIQGHHESLYLLYFFLPVSLFQRLHSVMNTERGRCTVVETAAEQQYTRTHIYMYIYVLLCGLREGKCLPRWGEK